MNNNEVKNKMVEILESQVKLVKDLEIVKVKELSSKCKITFKYNNMEATEELQKTCTPQYEIELCRKCINGAISSMYINIDNLIEAKKWLDDEEIWKEIDKENKENIDEDLLEILENIRIKAFKDYSKEKFIKCVKNEIRDMKKDNRLNITNKLNDRDLIMVFIGILSNDVE